MGDEADYAEAESWGLGYAMNAPRDGYDDNAPQPRSFLNPRGLSRHAQRLEEAQMRLTMTPEISVKRGGIQWPHIDESRNFVEKIAPLWQIKQEGQRMRATEDILAEAQSMRDEAARLEAIAEQRSKYGDDPFKNGTVLKVDMKYRTGNRSYAYAVIKVGGKFYLSGRMGVGGDVNVVATADSSRGYTWDNFVAWLSQGDATVWQAGSLKQVL
jgi:hypothetical protein